METITRLVARNDSGSESTLTPLMIKLLIALVVVVSIGILLIGALLILRSHRKKQQRKSELPLYNSSKCGRKSNHRRLTITASPYGRKSESAFVHNEKQAFIDDSASPPASPVPEIRITFPDEEDHSGNRKSGRVVVVKISDKGGVGLEPYSEEFLPRYQTSESDRFQSLDLERMGGLKEKEHGKQWS